MKVVIANRDDNDHGGNGEHVMKTVACLTDQVTRARQQTTRSVTENISQFKIARSLAYI